jgi:hypothetical protein
MKDMTMSDENEQHDPFEWAEEVIVQSLPHVASDPEYGESYVE